MKKFSEGNRKNLEKRPETLRSINVDQNEEFYFIPKKRTISSPKKEQRDNSGKRSATAYVSCL